MPYFRTGVRQYILNVSNNQANPDNTVTALAGVDTPLHMDGAGNVPFESRTIADGYCSFDSTYNGDKGGVITRKITRDASFVCRVTVVNTGTPTDAIVGCVIVFSDDGSGNPTSSTTIQASSQRFIQDEEGAPVIKFFGNNIVAIYPFIRSELERSFRLNGFEVTAFEGISPT